MTEAPVNPAQERREKLRPDVRRQFPDLDDDETEILLDQMVRDEMTRGAGPRW